MILPQFNISVKDDMLKLSMCKVVSLMENSAHPLHLLNEIL